MAAAPAIRSFDLDADVIVLGAGAAGLSFAAALADPGRRVRLLVLEPRRLAPNPRRWVIAAEPGHVLSRFADVRFSSVTLNGRTSPLRQLRIDHVPAKAVQARALDRLAASPVARIEDEVQILRMGAANGAVTVETSLGKLTARAVLDTRPGAAGAVAGGRWTQIVKLAALRGVDAPAGLSISRFAPEAGGVGLSQILVLPGGEALVEAVRFAAPGDDGAGLDERLDSLVQELGGETVGPRRRLVLPLEFDRAPSRDGPAVIARAGAGGLRFATGTAAVRLTRWAEAAAARFAETGRLEAPRRAPAQARAASRLALARLKSGPELAAAWFNAVLDDAPPERALRFLAGTPGWRDGALAFIRARRPA